MHTQQTIASNLYSIGAERLALLGKHHKILMQGYLEGFIDETALSDSALKKLMAARIVWRPSEQQPLMLRPLVSELIASMVSDENRRQVNADVAERLVQIRNRVQAYREAQHKGDYSVAELQLQRLTEQVHDLSGQFEEAIDSLWNRLNSDFGFVRSLNDKIRENERAQQQLRRLLDGLALLDFNELIELAEGNNHLRKLLVSQLQTQLSDHHGSLLEVQKRLIELLAKFRQQQSRSLLINNMVAYLRQHPAYSPADYPNRTPVPVLFNQAAPIKLQAAAALDRASDRQILAALVQQLPHQPKTLITEHQSANFSEVLVNEEIAAHQQALKQDVENFYLEVIDNSESVSALTYLKTQNLPWDGEIWLYQILADYQSLPRDEQKMFSLRNEETPASASNQLMLISDIHIRLRVF
ncbi:hypothetical protein SAMN02745127_03090 [Oceanospirillum multiglobuliferum]|uniref:DUF3375 domain-containing protein n=1 Tax=Oceanospirillum multiglobuliferum TaxID=64969 RepID=A0A1T4SIC6_9GAMM|nr:hypothetical protein [Oceanospirillum multiglobuliferum]OPX54117.1 hypothetical protein BTE48_15895 [Oceanospirillum multiglobuliferum]SKA27905.1 hypothetical protein SAMN02745127_03090 [Oceanospirillum multiglobuliferum]